MQSLKCQNPDLDFTSQEKSWRRTERREAYSKYCFMKIDYELKDVLKQPVNEKKKKRCSSYAARFVSNEKLVRREK